MCTLSGVLALSIALSVAPAVANRRTEWVDPDTPPEEYAREINGVRHVLVFSDEFEEEGRTFKDGDDSVWTALRGPVFSNYQYNAYNDSLVYTRGGKLVLETTANDWTYAPYDPTLKRHYQTAMLQSWNKFCFTGGHVEFSAKMPGRAHVAAPRLFTFHPANPDSTQPGLWPAGWLLGNLGRAIYPASTDNIWPFNFDQCPATPEDKRASQFGSQIVNACNNSHGRGAPEIDILEVMPGRHFFNYTAEKIETGLCGPLPKETLRLLTSKMPFQSTSVIVAPGRPGDAIERAKSGCLPEGYIAPDGSTRLQHYPELYPSADKYGSDPNQPGVIYGSEYNVTINYEFYGDTYYPRGRAMHTDVFSADTNLGTSHFERQHRYSCYWDPDQTNGHVTMRLDDKLQFHVPAAIFTEPKPVNYADGSAGGTLLGRRVPDEPMSLIFNVDVSPRWGWAECDPSKCDCCEDCKQSRCTTCFEVQPDGKVINTREWLAELCEMLPAAYEVDWIRIYQKEDAVNVGCDPEAAPTAEWIQKHRKDYLAPGDEEPLKAVVPGGAACTPAPKLRINRWLAKNSTCGLHGTCGDNGACRCDAGWTGPTCRSRQAGWARICSGLSDKGFRRPDAALRARRARKAGEHYGSARNACGVLEWQDFDELDLLIGLQCDLADREAPNGTEAAAACADVRAGGKYAGCSIRQRANHVLGAWAGWTRATRGDAECCSLLIHTHECQRFHITLPTLALACGSAWAMLLVPLLSSRLRRRLAGAALSLLVPPLMVCARCSCRVSRRLRRLCRRSVRWSSPLRKPLPPWLKRSSHHAASAAPGHEPSALDGAYHRGSDGRVAQAHGSARDSGELEIASLESPSPARHGSFLASGLPAIAPRTRVPPAALVELAAVFEELGRTFGFQPDSVRTQREHLSRLWEAQTASAGDEELAMQQLHSAHFETFERWLDASAGLVSHDRQQGVVVVKYRESSHEQRLREMALFLCLWGEAGNVRFCPEILCFFFECARRHVPPSLAGATSARKAREAEPQEYLRRYVQPLWQYIFDAGFCGFSTKGAPIARPLAEGESRINYDDINEMSWTPERIRRIVTHEGVPVIDFPTSKRWVALASADWEASMRGCKLHNEVNSWHCLFGGYARIVAFHAATFYLLLLLSHRLYQSDPNGWLQLRTEHNSLAVDAGVLLPGIVQLAADLAKVRIQPSLTVLTTLFAYDRSLIYILHFALFLVVTFFDDADYIRTAYYTVSAIVVLRATFFPRSFRKNEARFDAHIYEPPGTLLPMALFWVVAFSAKATIEMNVVLRAVVQASERLEALKPLQPFLDFSLLQQVFTSPALMTRFGQQMMLWSVSFLSYCSSTYFWVVLTACVFGAVRGLYILHVSSHGQEEGTVHPFKASDLPAAFVSQIFPLDASADGAQVDGTHFVFPALHPALELQWAKCWNAICTSMFDAWIISVHDLKGLVYAGQGVDEGSEAPFTRPRLFEKGRPEKDEQLLPKSPEFRRRFFFLWQSLKMAMPRPAPVEEIPAFSVLIPHFNETIITTEAELFAEARRANPRGSTEPESLMALLMEYFPDEYRHFRERVGERMWRLMWEVAAGREVESEAVQPAKCVLLQLRKWASMRQQTLYRTVRGMLLYQQALDLLLSVQRPDLTEQQRSRIVSDKFQCVVTMQRYFSFDSEMNAAAEELLRDFPTLIIMAIEQRADASACGGMRYFSCLIDADCAEGPDGRRVPRTTVELPGYPILGDGKGDNQNHALPFVHGRLVQTIDVNQEGYLEEALKICNALAEFSNDPASSRDNVSIVGFREHIYSSLGTVAGFAASSEFVFGTMLQRVLDRPLVSRQYYIMDKAKMMAQGGVSKATKVLNLSEDVFAGMDLTLRGGLVCHREYLQVGKGREMSFTGHLRFISKLSRGCAEMTFTRQAYRLGTRLSFLRMLGFYYGHIAFYLTPLLLELALWLFTFLHTYFAAVELALSPPYISPDDPVDSYSAISATLLNAHFGQLCLLFMAGQAVPYFAELSINVGPSKALWAVILQLVSFSWAFFSFQAQLMGFSFRNEISRGGASYMGTGRSIGTVRVPFHTLYSTFAASNMLPGLEILLLDVAILALQPSQQPGPTFWLASGMIASAWLYAPSLFNPKMFSKREILLGDVVHWWRWVKQDGPDGWRSWQCEDLRAQSKRPYSVFVLPGRRVLAAFALLALLRDLVPAELTVHSHRHTLESMLICMPVTPIVLVALALPCVQALRVPTTLVVAPLLVACHALEAVFYQSCGTALGAAHGKCEPLPRGQLAVLMLLRFFGIGIASSVLCWITSVEHDQTREDGADRHGDIAGLVAPQSMWDRASVALGAALRAVVREMTLGYYLLVDSCAMLCVLGPMLLVSLVPCIEKAHLLLLFRVMPGKSVDATVETFAVLQNTSKLQPQVSLGGDTSKSPLRPSMSRFARARIESYQRLSFDSAVRGASDMSVARRDSVESFVEADDMLDGALIGERSQTG